MELITIEPALETAAEQNEEFVADLSLEQLSQVGGGVFGVDWV